MKSYCEEGTTCRRLQLLSHFGEGVAAGPGGGPGGGPLASCRGLDGRGMCDVCDGSVERAAAEAGAARKRRAPASTAAAAPAQRGGGKGGGRGGRGAKRGKALAGAGAGAAAPPAKRQKAAAKRALAPMMGGTIDAEAEAGAAWFEEGARDAPMPRAGGGWKRKQGEVAAALRAAGPFASAVRAGAAPAPRARPEPQPPGNVIVLSDSDF